MRKQNSRLGLIISVAVHALLGLGVLYLIQRPAPKIEEKETAISMEMMSAMLRGESAPAPEGKPDAPAKAEKVAKPETKPQPQQKPATPEKPVSKPVETAKPIALQPKPQPKPEPAPKSEPEPKVKPDVPKPVEPVKPAEKALKPVEKAVEKPAAQPQTNAKKADDQPAKGIANGAKSGVTNSDHQDASRKGNLTKGDVKGAPQGNAPSGSNAGQADKGDKNDKADKKEQASDNSAEDIANYRALLQRKLQARAMSRYPQREKMMRKTGTVTLRFKLTESGVVTNVDVVSSSGNDNLDAAAVSAADGLNVGSPPPAGFAKSVSVPVRFSLN